MKLMKLIGLCGYARTGKDTAAGALVANGWSRVAFADALKDEVVRTFGTTPAAMEANKADWRPMLVEWGRARRRQDPDYWITRVMATVADRLNTGVVISDVRYWNEAKYIKDHGGVIVRLHRPGFEAANEEELSTISLIDGASKILGLHNLVNDSSVETLHRNILAIAREL
jgi:hypothetical protein